MFELAYSDLLRHGRLSNRYLLSTEGARLPHVRVLPGRGIVLATYARFAEGTVSIAADRDDGPAH